MIFANNIHKEIMQGINIELYLESRKLDYFYYLDRN